ncbi:MAG: glycerophosphodiester phosphodiesterase [Chloroflexi bacterium]|nr:glycerophosphodiester phosphodiesterase [Chloroflexota bacterium]
MKPLVLAHRGASAVAPENTLTAFDCAFEMGADGIELDVTLTKDGIPVVIHDDNVDRTTNGHGPIKQMTLAEVKTLDAGSWFDTRFRGAQIPTLAQVLEAVRGHGIVNIELKSVTLKSDGLEQVVAKVVEQAGMRDRVIISSFNPFALNRMANCSPRLPRGLLYADNLPIYLRRAWLRPIAHPRALHPKYTMVTPKLVNWAKSKGYAVNTWTVDDPEEMRRLIGLGVNAIMTNRPDRLKQVLENS